MRRFPILVQEAESDKGEESSQAGSDSEVSDEENLRPKNGKGEIRAGGTSSPSHHILSALHPYPTQSRMVGEENLGAGSSFSYSKVIIKKNSI
jgi:hypothetical protein